MSLSSPRRHEKLDWLTSNLFSLKTGREGMRVYLQEPGDTSNTWTLWMQPEARIPCFWLLARNLPGKVCMCTKLFLALKWAELTRG